MKTIKTVLVLFCLFSSILVTAQDQYQYPSPEIVDTILNGLDYCKRNLKVHQEEMARIEANPEEYSLADYRRVKETIPQIETCIKSLRDQLEKLRKDYPGWFNNPNAVANGKKKGDHITPKQVEIDYDALYKKIRAAIERFGLLKEPKH